MKLSRLKRITVVFFVLLLIAAIWIVFNPPRAAHAANPATGAISPTGPNVVWQGPVTGGAGANEDTCVEGANCDTFKLTLTGTKVVWINGFVRLGKEIPFEKFGDHSKATMRSKSEAIWNVGSTQGGYRLVVKGENGKASVVYLLSLDLPEIQ
jgi:hypothetical protein